MVHMGYVYAALMLVSKVFEATLQAWHAHLMTRVALRARSGFISLIYRKCLWLSGFGSGTTIGNIQNLMAKLFRIIHDLIQDVVVGGVTLTIRQMSVMLTARHKLHASVFRVRIINRQPHCHSPGR